MRTDKFRFPAYLPVALALAVGLMTLSVTGSLAPSYAREIAVVPPDGILHGPARVIDGDTIDIRGHGTNVSPFDFYQDGTDYSQNNTATLNGSGDLDPWP